MVQKIPQRQQFLQITTETFHPHTTKIFKVQRGQRGQLEPQGWTKDSAEHPSSHPTLGHKVSSCSGHGNDEGERSFEREPSGKMKQLLEGTKKRKNVCKTHSDGLGMASGNKDMSFHILCKSTRGRREAGYSTQLAGLPKVKILNPQIHAYGAESREFDVNRRGRVM